MRKVKFETIEILLGLFLACSLVACSSGRGGQPDRQPVPPHDPLAETYRADLEETARALRLPIAATRSVDLEMNIPAHVSVRAAVNYFSGPRRETIQSSFLRSGPWVPMIQEVLAEYGLPPDLAYLPVIESGYRSGLTSKAGAHGMWQFMPATAREYGLRVDWWVDERADPWKSTRAAAHYLSDLYRMFDDWPLALAAYNCGPGRVRRTLDRESATTFWELLERGALPRETRGYVPTFYATIALAGSPEQFGFQLPLPLRIDYDAVPVRGPVSLRYIAQSNGMDQAAFEKLNPDLHRGIVPPEIWSLKVPRGSAHLIAARSWHLEDPSVGVSSYVTRETSTVEDLSARFGIDVSEMRSINGLRDTWIAHGTTIWVPVHQTELSARLARSAATDGWYVVRPGDTLYSIAKRNGLTVEELAELNRLGSDEVIHPGRKLLIRTPSISTGGM